MTRPTLVFDLDGTLVDTAPDLVRANDYTLSLLGLPPAPETVVRPLVSHGSRRMIIAGLAHHDVTLPDAEVDALWQRFLAYYGDNVAVASRPFDGLEAVLARWAERGALLAVCTNKFERLSRILLEALGLARYFAAIAGRDTFPVCKPDPGHLTGAIRLTGGNISRAVLIGDSEVDLATARAAGVPMIGVTFGYSDPPMRALRPDAIIDHYAELDDALARLLPA